MLTLRKAETDQFIQSARTDSERHLAVDDKTAVIGRKQFQGLPLPEGKFAAHACLYIPHQLDLLDDPDSSFSQQPRGWVEEGRIMGLEEQRAHIPADKHQRGGDHAAGDRDYNSDNPGHLVWIVRFLMRRYFWHPMKPPGG
jgi:hypothetical protein